MCGENKLRDNLDENVVIFFFIKCHRLFSVVITKSLRLGTLKTNCISYLGAQSPGSGSHLGLYCDEGLVVDGNTMGNRGGRYHIFTQEIRETEGPELLFYNNLLLCEPGFHNSQLIAPDHLHEGSIFMALTLQHCHMDSHVFNT
jgi:hypothetical protein